MASYEISKKVRTATVVRNCAGVQLNVMQRIETFVRCVHDDLVVPASLLQEEPAVRPQLVNSA